LLNFGAFQVTIFLVLDEKEKLCNALAGHKMRCNCSLHKLTLEASRPRKTIFYKKDQYQPAFDNRNIMKRVSDLLF
jgi:hypothetical protein